MSISKTFPSVLGPKLCSCLSEQFISCSFVMGKLSGTLIDQSRPLNIFAHTPYEMRARSSKACRGLSPWHQSTSCIHSPHLRSMPLSVHPHPTASGRLLQLIGQIAYFPSLESELSTSCSPRLSLSALSSILALAFLLLIGVSGRKLRQNTLIGAALVWWNLISCSVFWFFD